MKAFLRHLVWRVYMLKPIRALYVKLIRKLWLFYPMPKEAKISNTRYSIGVVTYLGRYKTFFKPLIRQLCTLFPDTEIVINVNGYYDQGQQEKYLRTIKAFLAQHANVKLFTHTEPQSLSKLWNQLIIVSSYSRILILNDDVLLLPSFRRHLENSGALAKDVAILKMSWSHFMIAKKIIATAGWFDERFPGVGNEDEDYEARLALLGESLQSIELGGLKNISVKTKDFSYGKSVDVVKGKYMSANKRFFDSKWELSNEPRVGSAYVRILSRYAKIRPGMETPDFHPEINYEQEAR